MTTKDDLKSKLKKNSSEAAARVDALLADEYAALLNATKTDFDALRPQIKAQAIYDQFISIVEEATSNNLSIAAFQQRLETLGSGALEIGKQVASILKY